MVIGKCKISIMGIFMPLFLSTLRRQSEFFEILQQIHFNQIIMNQEKIENKSSSSFKYQVTIKNNSYYGNCHKLLVDQH